MKNWKTTLLGIATGFFAAAVTGFANGEFQLNLKSFLAFALPTLFGIVSKDFNVSNAPSPGVARNVN